MPPGVVGARFQGHGFMKEKAMALEQNTVFFHLPLSLAGLQVKLT
jgi:hypothetical protein